MRPLYPNPIWSVDFVQDRLFRGRRYKMLTVIDEYTRQCITVNVQFQLTSQEVLDTEAFYSLTEAQSVIEQWVHQYNHIRPHQSLDYRPPVPETVVPTLSQTLVHNQGA